MDKTKLLQMIEALKEGAEHHQLTQICGSTATRDRYLRDMRAKGLRIVKIGHLYQIINLTTEEDRYNAFVALAGGDLEWTAKLCVALDVGDDALRLIFKGAMK
jgi:hypothetical protein